MDCPHPVREADIEPPKQASETREVHAARGRCQGPPRPGQAAARATRARRRDGHSRTHPRQYRHVLRTGDTRIAVGERRLELLVGLRVVIGDSTAARHLRLRHFDVLVPHTRLRRDLGLRAIVVAIRGIAPVSRQAKEKPAPCCVGYRL